MSSNQQFRIAMLSDPARGAVRMSCQNAGCEQDRNGWVTVLDPANEKHAAALRWLRGDQGRHFVELRSEDAAEWVVNHGVAQGVTDNEGKLSALIARTPPGLLLLLFPPGQQCLRVHVDREVVFAHVDARQNVRVHEARDFNEHHNEELYRYAEMVKRG